MREEKDHGFKSMAEHDLEGLIRILGGIGWDTPITVIPEERELSLRYRADVLCRVIAPDLTAMYHFEAESNFESEDANVALARSAAAGVKYKLDVKPFLVLHSPDRPAATFNPNRVLDMRWVKLTAEFEVKRLWEEDPEPILSRNRIHLMPMVIAMNATPEQIREASLRIDMVRSDAERRRLHEEMVTYGSIRYTEAEIDELTGRVERSMLPPMELVRETEIGRRIEALGEFNGRAAGRHEGLRKAILAMLRIRFPELAIPESALPRDEEQLSAILNLALTTSDSAEVRLHILGH